MHRVLLVLTILLSPIPVTSTPASDALDWVIDASHRVPVTAAEQQELAVLHRRGEHHGAAGG